MDALMVHQFLMYKLGQVKDQSCENCGIHRNTFKHRVQFSRHLDKCHAMSSSSRKRRSPSAGRSPSRDREEKRVLFNPTTLAEVDKISEELKARVIEQSRKNIELDKSDDPSLLREVNQVVKNISAINPAFLETYDTSASWIFEEDADKINANQHCKAVKEELLLALDPYLINSSSEKDLIEEQDNRDKDLEKIIQANKALLSQKNLTGSASSASVNPVSLKPFPREKFDFPDNEPYVVSNDELRLLTRLLLSPLAKEFLYLLL